MIFFTGLNDRTINYEMSTKREKIKKKKHS